MCVSYTCTRINTAVLVRVCIYEISTLVLCMSGERFVDAPSEQTTDGALLRVCTSLWYTRYDNMYSSSHSKAMVYHPVVSRQPNNTRTPEEHSTASYHTCVVPGTNYNICEYTRINVKMNEKKELELGSLLSESFFF